MTITLTDVQFNRLKDYVEAENFCPMCRRFPGPGHTRHDNECPLRIVCKHRGGTYQDVVDKRKVTFCYDCDTEIES